jgi:hypothetical protein
VLKKLAANLPMGWSLTTDRDGESALWTIYQEAEVATAVKGGKRRFTTIYEMLNSFTIFRVTSLSIPTTGGSSSTRIVGLPPYFARAKDTFVELQENDVAECIRRRTGWCRFHTAVGKADTQGSCAWALFTESEEEVKRICKVPITEWPGTQVIYVGKRRWALSALKQQKVEINCPGLDRRVVTVPALGIFEVPPGCSARTREWIFPASIEGVMAVDMEKESRTLPPLSVLHQFDPHEEEAGVQLKGESEGRADLDKMAELVRRTNGAIRETEMTADQANKMVGEENSKPYSHDYPFEWILAILVITLLLTIDKVRNSRGMTAVGKRIETLEEWTLAYDLVLAGLHERTPAGGI